MLIISEHIILSITFVFRSWGGQCLTHHIAPLSSVIVPHRIHTDAIKVNLIPAEVTREQAAMKYADEADVLNIAMFGMTAKQWREQNPDKKGNIRDYASINELICLSNMENLNAVFINDGMAQSERLIKLNQIAIQQMKILEDTGGRNLLK